MGKTRTKASAADGARAERGQRAGRTARTVFVGIGILLVVGIVTALFNASQPVSPAAAGDATVSNADRIEVVYFHRTERCDSCLWTDQVSRRTVETYFAQEFASGRVTFQEVDVQKPENRAMAARYRAGGSQLFVNYVKDGQDHIVEARQAYPFVGNEARFSDALRLMIAAGLGES